MTKDKMIYSESIEYVNEVGLKRWKRFELGAALNEDDNQLECWKELEEDVKHAKIQSFNPPPMIRKEGEPIEPTYQFYPQQPLPTIDYSAKENVIASHIKTINECKTLNNLKIFEKLVTNTNNNDLSNAYMAKHEELFSQNKKSNQTP